MHLPAFWIVPCRRGFNVPPDVQMSPYGLTRGSQVSGQCDRTKIVPVDAQLLPCFSAVICSRDGILTGRFHSLIEVRCSSTSLFGSSKPQIHQRLRERHNSQVSGTEGVNFW